MENNRVILKFTYLNEIETEELDSEKYIYFNIDEFSEIEDTLFVDKDDNYIDTSNNMEYGYPIPITLLEKHLVDCKNMGANFVELTPYYDHCSYFLYPVKIEKFEKGTKEYSDIKLTIKRKLNEKKREDLKNKRTVLLNELQNVDRELKKLDK